MSEPNPYPDDMLVEVKHPLNAEQLEGDREGWPWLPGTVLEQCGPDEWRVCVEALELATMGDGQPAPEGTPEHKMWFPVVFRDSSEIRPEPEAG
jgi:hypothetical protein